MRGANEVRGEYPIHHIAMIERPDGDAPLLPVRLRVDTRYFLQQFVIGPSLIAKKATKKR